MATVGDDIAKVVDAARFSGSPRMKLVTGS
jgi:hypothetical protein